MKKILLSTVLTLAFLLPPVVHAASFSDIQEGSELEKMVEYLVDQGTVSGYPDGTFKLEKTINRAEALKIIFETIKVGLEENTDSGFPDVDPQQWYAKYVTSAKKKGIVLGYEDGYFRPEQEVNKAEFIKMALLALPFYERIPKKLSRINRSYHYEYIRPEQWYAEYVIAADKMGFIIPDMLPIRWFFPDEQMQRQDAIEIIYKIDKYVETNTLSINNPSIFFPEEAEGVINNYYEELNEELIQESYKSGNHGEDFNTFREKYLSDYQSNIFDHTFQGTMWSNIGGITAIGNNKFRFQNVKYSLLDDKIYTSTAQLSKSSLGNTVSIFNEEIIPTGFIIDKSDYPEQDIQKTITRQSFTEGPPHYVFKKKDQKLYSISLKNRDIIPLENLKISRYSSGNTSYYNPIISGDLKRMYFLKGNDIWFSNTDGTDLKRITFFDNPYFNTCSCFTTTPNFVYDGRVQISHDGSKLLFDNYKESIAYLYNFFTNTLIPYKGNDYNIKSKKLASSSDDEVTLWDLKENYDHLVNRYSYEFIIERVTFPDSKIIPVASYQLNLPPKGRIIDIEAVSLYNQKVFYQAYGANPPSYSQYFVLDLETNETTPISPPGEFADGSQLFFHFSPISEWGILEDTKGNNQLFNQETNEKTELPAIKGYRILTWINENTVVMDKRIEESKHHNLFTYDLSTQTITPILESYNEF